MSKSFLAIMKKIHFFLSVVIGLLAISLFTFAQGLQDGNKVIEYDLSTPYHTIRTQLEYLQNNLYYPEISAKTLDAQDLTEEERIELTIKLKEIYDGLGKYINVELIPKNPGYLDSATNTNRYQVLKDEPRLYVEKVGSRWLYSRESVAAIEGMYEEVYPFKTYKLLELARYFNQGRGGGEFLGLMLWQHIALLLLIIFGATGHKVLTFVLKWLIDQLLSRVGMKKTAAKLIIPVARPLSVFIILSAVVVAFPLMQIPVKYSQYFLVVLKAIIPFFAVMVLYKMIDILSHYMTIAATRTDTTLDDQLVPIVRKSLKIFVFIGGVLFILQNLEFNITGLLAGISIGGLAFALAAQDTIKNLFGSLMIFVDRPFQVGDWIVGSGVDGSVEEVGFRSTRVRTFHNSVVSIPNGNIANMTVDNMGLRSFRRFKTSISITYDTPPEVIEVFVEGLRQIVLKHPDTWKDNFHIYLNNFGPSSLDILFYIFFSVPDWGKELEARHQVMLEVIHLAQKLGVRFAFPTSTVHVEDFPGQPSLTPEYQESKEEMMTKIKAFYAQGNGKN